MLADIVIRGGQVFCSFTREWLERDIAVCDGYVVALGDHQGHETIDAEGDLIVPRFVDADPGARDADEAKTIAEARERLRTGEWLLLSERNVFELLPLVDEHGLDRIAFRAYECEPAQLVREAVSLGLPPEDALVLASLNPARYRRLPDLGAIAPGYRAEILFLSDLETFVPERVLERGRPLDERAPGSLVALVP